ncbi:MAG: hypothetical protein JWN93_3604 [Hyphomicrobiales bacterium]|nr:hypothetical protein [Hyphomicrobiales bacterium]
MPEPSSSAPRPPAGAPATTDRLRWEIDSGRTGDKVAYSDPAAAPLGTDDEAAGAPPSERSIETALAAETANNPGRTGPQWFTIVAMAAVVAVVALSVLSVLWRAP